MPDVVYPELLITLVHGTWGRGFFPGRQRKRRPPWWFEDGSPFLERLSGGIGDIPHRIKPLLWSGANSIFERDRTAELLADYLAAEHAEHPQARQLVIAHSHGGNIALRALYHLRVRDGLPAGEADRASPLIATLATPFIEIHRADFGERPAYIRFGLATVLTLISIVPMFGLLLAVDWLAPALMRSIGGVLFNVGFFGVMIAGVGLGIWWIFRDRQKQVAVLEDATRLSGLVSGRRLLVIRAIDDEASLVLAFGTIMNYAAERLIAFLLFTSGVLTMIIAWGQKWLPHAIAFWGFPVTFGCWILFTLLSAGALMVSRMAHGRELAISPMECQINTQSAPDTADLSQVVTLVSRKLVKSLRHGIYEHEDCARTIADWVRARVL
jgi:hypothetical protein